MSQNEGASPHGDRATHERGQSSLSPPSVGIPSADERLAELLALEENWNSYRGRPIDRAVADRVRAFFPLAEMMGLQPWICPLSNGGLQVERAGTDDWSAEFAPDGTVSVYFDGLTDKDALGIVGLFAQLKALDALASGTLTEGGDVKQAPGDSLSGPTRAAGDAQPLGHNQSR